MFAYHVTRHGSGHGTIVIERWVGKQTTLPLGLKIRSNIRKD
ncbi:hypothetical protein DsansV1_C21g0169891 [Dioscorea sansibarensis]